MLARVGRALPSTPTTGTDQRFKRLVIDGRHVGVSVWDTAGQDRFASLTPMYYR
jgi:GTPase SAR1 family protein